MALKTILGKINKAREKYEQAKQEASEGIQEEIGKAIAEAFKKVPEVFSAVKWTQYTPYFNDGDACEFSVHEPELVAEGEDPDDTYAVLLEEHGDEMGAWSIDYAIEKGRAPAELKVQLAPLFEVLDTIMENEEVLEAAFGDHVKVVISRDGTVSVDDYNHD